VSIELLAQRLVDAVRFLEREPAASGLRFGLFGASMGAAAALVAAARLGNHMRPDPVDRGGPVS
jgi:dipeptidyl aminopeptidase/acylaminoacyl peptidase